MLKAKSLTRRCLSVWHWQTFSSYIAHQTRPRQFGYSWRDGPVAEVSEMDTVNAAREEWEEMHARERNYI